jgi:hypothetical protein
MSMMEVHGVRRTGDDNDKAVTVNDGYIKVGICIEGPYGKTAVYMDPEEARFIAAALIASADRVEKADEPVTE